ncbi:MAG: tricarballylate utilization 4Fe-4S protein TcuB [Acetobacteraceae bacterium]|nr:tricarballylate utilization 4Fe-4S protein TcuB [Acetobacteraceae bacterium]
MPAPETDTVAEARRQMMICNACRYCEGYCAVFPAMARRRDFPAADLTHLANLCHSCRGCFHACQYAPPHAFGVNIPATFATLRQESYQAAAWPAPMARAFERNGTLVALLGASCMAAVLLLAMALVDPRTLYAAQLGQGAFFRVIPMWLMVALASAGFGYAVLALAMGARTYLRQTGGAGGVTLRAVLVAMHDVLTLKNLGGGGHGCNDLDDRFTHTRRWLHQAMAFGFLLCFAATCMGAVYHHLLGWHSPHPFWSWPVQLGTWGGVLLCLGTAGTTWVKVNTDPAPIARRLLGGEYAMLSLLFLVGSTGLLLLSLRHTGAMGVLLALHLGLVLALLLALPYSKMVHGAYRSIALLRDAGERGAPPSLS